MNITDTDWNDLQVIWDYLHIEDDMPDTADAIVVGGAGLRTDMAERASELFHEKRAPLIIFSGFKHPTLGVVESDLLADKAIALGVPGTAIIREPLARNTGLNIILAAKKLDELEIEPNRIILVCKPFMTRRLKATAEAQWPRPQPEFFATSINISMRDYDKIYRDHNEGDRMVLLMLGDYARMAEYAQRGWQTPQPKSPEAEAAFQRLLARGFIARKEDFSLSTEVFDAENKN